MHENAHCHYILLLDANCNTYDKSHPYSKILLDFVTRNSLLNCYDLRPNFDHTTSYSRCDTKTNSYTLIDAIIISKALSKHVSNIRISDYGDNVSDHLPVEIDLEATLKSLVLPSKKATPAIVWDKLDSITIANFQQCMTEKLDGIAIPFNNLHGDLCCSNENHFSAIQNYHDQCHNAGG